MYIFIQFNSIYLNVFIIFYKTYTALKTTIQSKNYLQIRSTNY